MKIVMKSKEKKIKLKKPINKPKKEQVLIVAQEIKFARLLSGNEKKTRDRVLKTLKKWLINCFQKKYDFKLDDFTRVWKGLFYAVWMSDKPLVQEELCESIAGILDLFPTEQTKHAMLMVKAGLRVLATEWYGIDQHRMDKFLMLVRRYLRGSFRVLKRAKWSKDSCEAFANVLSSPDGILAVNTPLYARNGTSMIMHFMDCFLEELSKVSEGAIPASSVAILYQPFCKMLCLGTNPVLYTGARRSLTELLRQSESGLDYMDRYRAWQKMGCPAGGPEALEPASDDDDADENGDEQAASDDHMDDDNGEKPLDPRAGSVHVVLTPIPVPSQQLALCLKGLLPKTSSKAYKRTKICIERFETLSKGQYPLRESETDMESRGTMPQASKVAAQLLALDTKLISDSDELALRGLSRKHRKRLLAKSRAGLSIVDDVTPPPLSKQNGGSGSTDGDWLVEDTEPLKKKQKVLQENNKKEKIKQKKNKKHKGKIVESVKVQKTGKDAVDGKVKNKNNNEKQQKSEEKVYENKDNNKKQKVKHEKKILKQSKKPVTLVFNVGKTKTEKGLIKKAPVLLVNSKAKNIQKTAAKEKQVKKLEKPTADSKKLTTSEKMQSVPTPKKVKFVLKNNTMQQPIDYYKSIRQSPNIPFDSKKQPIKTNLKPSTPSPINPFFKRKLRMRK